MKRELLSTANVVVVEDALANMKQADSDRPSGVVIYAPFHSDFSQLEYVAPFFERFHGSKIFIYKTNGVHDIIRDHLLSPEYKEYNLGVHDFTLENLVFSIAHEDPKKRIVFLLTGSLGYTLTQYQVKIFDALKEIFPDRVWGYSVVGHCMYGCSSCKGNEHRIPVYYTRYFRKQYVLRIIRNQRMRM